MTKTQQHLVNIQEPTRDTWADYIKELDVMLKDLRETFDMLEHYAKQLPGQLPQIDPMNRLRTVFQEEQLDLYMMDTVEMMIDCCNWNEGNFQTYSFLGEFLRMQRKKPSSVIPRPLSYSNWAHEKTPHAQFEIVFNQFQKDLLKNKTGIFPTFLERTAMGCIVELKFGVFYEKQIVYTQKMLMMENCGVIEMLILVAPHEEWHFYEDLGEKRVDLTKQSRYTVYQKLTTQANFHLMQTINSQDLRWNVPHLHQLINAFGRLQQVFEATCRNCKKVMKDFLPPLIFDFRNPKTVALHETCK